MSLKIKKLILLFLFLLFLSSSTPVHGDTRNNQVGLQAQPQIEPTIYDPKTSNFYTDIDPIYITSNASFIPEGFSGSGTSTEPYVLENCRITNNTEPNLICIINTDAYFIIRNNFLDGINKSPIGIYLSNVINGVVETNTIVNTRQGIHSVGNSNSNVITNNTIKDNKHGITASSSHNSSYTNNNIFNNTGSGIYFEELYQPTRALSGNIITNNTIYDNDGDGIFIECGTNNLVMNNSIMNNFLGIDIIDGEQNTIYNNTIIGNKGGLAIGNGLTDVFLLYASSNISRNTIMHNEEGLAIYSYGQFESERGPNNVSKNIIIQNGDGLYVGSSNYTITENIVYNNK
ncbi:MAG: nitrous oxide reductase family maturation protein NosD, partial [Candidatus Hodarchaeota archaeon]